MDPTTSGGRHSGGSGSIPVAELLAQRTRPVSRPARSSVHLVPLPAHLRDAHRADRAFELATGPGRLRSGWIRLLEATFAGLERRSRAIGRAVRALLGGGAAALLLASVVTGAVLAEPAPRVAVPAPVRQLTVDGAAALRPDVIQWRLRGTSSPAVPPPTTPAVATGGRTASPETAVRVVRDLFGALPHRPQGALTVLDPALADPSFGAAWSGIHLIRRVEVRAEGAGAVQVAAVLEHADGTRTRTQHRLVVHDRPQPRITGATLLSAQLL